MCNYLKYPSGCGEDTIQEGWNNVLYKEVIVASPDLEGGVEGERIVLSPNDTVSQVIPSSQTLFDLEGIEKANKALKVVSLYCISTIRDFLKEDITIHIVYLCA